MRDIRAIAATSTLMCGIGGRAGEVWCWGDQVPSQHPAWSGNAAVEGTPAASAVAVGDGHACALARDGRAFCWGGGFGALRAITGVPELMAIDADGAEVCGLGRDASLWCWGAELWADDLREAPVRVADGVAAFAVSGGGCFARVDGRVACWGHDRNGRLGSESASGTSHARILAR